MPDDYVPNPRRWRALTVSLVIGFMALLDVSVVNLALPSMQRGLHVSTGTVQWVVSGYTLAFGLTLVAGGRLGDAYGRRRLMLVGLVGFIATSAAVGLAPNITVLIAARLAQGATAGLLTPQNSGLIQHLFRGPERARAFGFFGLTVSASSAIGPVLGGLILAVAGEEHGWRYLFLINVPIGLVALVLVARLIPQRSVRSGGSSIDVVGALLLGLLVLTVLYPVVSLETGADLRLLLLLLAPVFATAFIRWERRTVRSGRAPLLDIALLRRVSGYASGLVIGGLYFTGYTGLILVLSFFLQDERGLSPLQTGLLLAPNAAAAALSASLSGRAVSVIGRRVTVAALSVMLIGMGLVALLAPGHGTVDVVLLVAALVVAGLGSGAVVSPNMTLTLADVPPRMGGAAGGAVQTSQRIGASVGSALVMTTFSLGAAHVSSAAALRLAMGVGLVLLAASLTMAVRDLRRSRG
ncbi:MFS transporter [Nocardioides sp. Kera G14]|uniref:MFS transporter n=1 Tax=Nocardioides sp. Kera G14 TaxID=2884264 RepID=UPI001D1008A5|nr:MFS transporter [Nocardioides sp. Kera G14]UDY23176.1 MFS transporter [Nocardioides sp. Kera G14]